MPLFDVTRTWHGVEAATAVEAIERAGARSHDVVRARQSGVPASECCDGSGFADYAAVPCPEPFCPVLAQEALRA